MAFLKIKLFQKIPPYFQKYLLVCDMILDCYIVYSRTDLNFEICKKFMLIDIENKCVVYFMVNFFLGGVGAQVIE